MREYECMGHGLTFVSSKSASNKANACAQLSSCHVRRLKIKSNTNSTRTRLAVLFSSSRIWKNVGSKGNSGLYRGWWVGGGGELRGLRRCPWKYFAPLKIRPYDTHTHTNTLSRNVAASKCGRATVKKRLAWLVAHRGSADDLSPFDACSFHSHPQYL